MLDQIKTGLVARDGGRRLVDFLIGGVLWRLPRAVRRRMFAGHQRHCPLCESDLRDFVVLNRDWYHWCPVCRSLQRHRLVWLLLHRLELSGRPVRILHIAPEEAIEERLRALPGAQYISADRYDPGAMLKMDIGAIQFADGVFDLVYCSHVLEHVPDDRLAMREMRRVLRPGGQAVIVVPILVDVTSEAPELTDPVERERRFGQHDHVRIYGPDVERRLEEAGLQVMRLTTEDLASPEEVIRLGLTPGETLFLCSAR
ncbi:MAG: hypothetical protein RLZZ387_1284 [Chloroflexota bacterium]